MFFSVHFSVMRISVLLRLVCESTVEENILKKANQKRMLGDIAIEGGVFTTDFFREVSEAILWYGMSE